MINLHLAVSCNSLPLYEGEMLLLPHQGEPCPGTGTLLLACGRVMRHLRVTFQAHGTLPELLGSTDGRFGRGTSFARIPGSSDFFVFVTSGRANRTLIGESELVLGGPDNNCDAIRIHLLNSLIPEEDAAWTFSGWRLSVERTECAYDLTRVSLPEQEINLTHVLQFRRDNKQPFAWREIEPLALRVLTFLSFANCSQVVSPVAVGYGTDGHVTFFRLATPPRSLPTNRRSWATGIGDAALQEGLQSFLSATTNTFWASILDRAVGWQTLAEAARYDSTEQALFVIQMLLEMLAYVVLVEDAQILGEDGYAKLPAADRITLLCGQTGQPIALQTGGAPALGTFCTANSIRNIGELIATLRNKLVHPTKKNREYLERVPSSVRSVAVTAGLQVVSLAILKVIGYNSEYYDHIENKRRMVPWRAPPQGFSG